MRRPRVTLWVLRIFMLLHAAMAVLQPIMAGIFLSGEADAMNDWHSPIGSTLWMIALLQIPVAALYAWPGGGRLLPLWMTLGLFFAEFVQLILGSTHQIAIHIPLGTLIVTAVVWFAIWTWRPVARQPRRLVAESKKEVPA